jgi:CubicO group peptidase (beta-lactamase class C family)
VKRAHLPLALVLALQPVAATAQSSAPVPIAAAQSSALDAALARTIAAVPYGAPAASVALVEDGRLVYAHATGLADVATRTAATPQTRFAIASITKLVTAVCVMQLVESGKLRLDAPITSLLPGVLPDVQQLQAITVRELLRHTSGLADYGDTVIADGSVAHRTTPRAIVARFAAKPLAFEPGTAWGYSNTDYVVLGLIVEKLSGESLAAYERAHVFAPAGMTATSVGPSPGSPTARGYTAHGRPAPPLDLSWFYADGDLFSTASDLARFDIALMDGVLVAPATFALMQANPVGSTVVAPGGSVAWGLGPSLVTVGTTTFVGHHGGLPGFAAEDEMLPDRRFALIVLGNASDFITARVNAAMLAVVLPPLVAASSVPAATVGAEEPKVTARLRTFVTDLVGGSVDRSQLDAAMNAAFTPAIATQAERAFGSFGALQTLTFRDRTQTMGLRIYHYAATFANGKGLVITFTLDSDDKIAGFYLE